MTTAPAKKFHDLIKDFDVAMLVTRTDDGQLRSRPMAIAEVEHDGALWLLTNRHSAKIDEIAHESHVNVTLQSKLQFISVSGYAEAVDDRQKIDSLWNESWKHWFPGGKDDPDLVLLKIHGETGEYWDNSGLSGIKYLFEAGKAYLKGTRPDVANDPDIHAKVKL